MHTPVSSPKNVWFNSRQVDDTDLTLEQNHNDIIQSGIINNHFGSGVLPDSLTQHILFDSSLSNGLLDGRSINAQAQPSDSNNGNILELELMQSLASGKRGAKVFIIGLDFNNNLQYDTFIFRKNEKQLTDKHYRNILCIFFNDFVGPTTESFNLGGKFIIREASPISLSRDCIMISQDKQPNIFLRDFFTTTGQSLENTLISALPSYNVDALNITTSYVQLRALIENDVSSQVGQKFIASTNNIQKITLLMSVVNNSVPANLSWSGDIIVSLYKLQATTNCSTDIVPQLAIDFDPSSVPLAQLSFNYSTLMDTGVLLNGVPQPVDFIFSNTAVGSGLLIQPGSYYAITVKRAGSAGTCQIQFATGVNSASNTRETLFNGSAWSDVSEESLWFQVWTDAAKVSDGQAYDNGHGIQIPKNQIDPSTQITKDYKLGGAQFVRNDVYNALLEADLITSVPIQDERTGNNVMSQQNLVPVLTLLNGSDLSNIQAVSDPLILGTISDKNVKAYSASSSLLLELMHSYGMINNQIVIKVITDSTDGYRYDPSIVELVSELVNGNLNGAKIIPNDGYSSLYYRINKAELLTMIYGDINGDGVVDANDLLFSNALVGADLNAIPSHHQYIVNTTLFEGDLSLHWQLLDSLSNVIASGVDGALTVNPNDGSIANFNSISVNFSTIVGINTYKISITSSFLEGNNSSFAIVGLTDLHNITIKKLYYTSDTILQLMRADISNNMTIDSTDISYISNYVNTVFPFPATTLPASRVGTSFNAIRLTLEEYVDRADDFEVNINTRNAAVHPVPDIYLDGYTVFAGVNLKTNPMQFSIIKQLTWNDYNVVCTSNPRLVPAAFINQTGYQDQDLPVNPNNISQSFPLNPAFDPGRNDIFFPNNIIINDGGQLTTPDGYYFKVDLEVGSLLLEMPDIQFDSEKIVNLLTDFVADFTGSGFTRIGYPAMRFADNSFVALNALALNQIRFNVAVQSFSPQLNGTDPACINGIIVDGKIGVSIDYGTGILTLNFNNLYQDPVKPTLNTKIQVSIYLKKAGWNNTPLFVSSSKLQNILGVTPVIGTPINCPDPTIIFVG